MESSSRQQLDTIAGISKERDYTEQTIEETEFPLDHRAETSSADKHDSKFECFLVPFLARLVGLLAGNHQNAFQPAGDSSSLHCVILEDSLDFSLGSNAPRIFAERRVSSDSNSTLVYEFQDSDEFLLEQQNLKERSYQLSDFQRHRILGEGQFGQVFLVSEKKSNKKNAYALKVHAKYDLVSDGQVDALIREKEIMKMVGDHPFIVELVSTFQDERMVYMLQEFCQGGELFSVMHDKGLGVGLPELQVKFYTLCIADAIAHMHYLKIVYRDLKPENVMIDSTGYIRLIDLGIAKVLQAKDEKAFTFCGTPKYLSPECVANRGHGLSTDHWSLGVLMYEMLTSENPFYWEGQDELSLFRSIEEDDFPPLPDSVSADAAAMLAGLLNKDPSTRLGSQGDHEILQHAWVQDIDLQALRRKELKAPWIPDIQDALDSSCFDDWEHLEDRLNYEYPTLMRKEAVLFDNF